MFFNNLLHYIWTLIYYILYFIFFFQVLDLVGNLDISGFDIAFDKGTYDAISLNPDNAVEKRQKYIQNVFNLLNDDGLFIITTCNWTDHEIVSQCKDGMQSYFVIYAVIILFTLIIPLSDDDEHSHDLFIKLIL